LYFPAVQNTRSSFHNVVVLSTDEAVVANRYLDGSYLLGHPNALYSRHIGPTPQLDCVQINEQANYAQTAADQLQAIVGKRYYWDGVSYFRMKEAGSNSTFWWYEAYLSSQIFANVNNSFVNRAQLGF
jgi:hypothetical protein